MGLRLDLHTILKTIVDNVYFQPPANVQLEYPCIIYSRDYADTRFADDMPYTYTKRYSVMVIDRDPDSELPDKVAALPMSTFNRYFATDGLNHDVFSVYY